jgi:hypothetical protein
MQILSQNQMQDVMGHPEVIIPEELLGHAVEKGPDAQELKIESGNIHLPLTYEQALKKKNTTHFGDSMHWFAALIMYQWMKYDPDIVRAVKKK